MKSNKGEWYDAVHAALDKALAGVGVWDGESRDWGIGADMIAGEFPMRLGSVRIQGIWCGSKTYYNDLVIRVSGGKREVNIRDVRDGCDLQKVVAKVVAAAQRAKAWREEFNAQCDAEFDARRERDQRKAEWLAREFPEGLEPCADVVAWDGGFAVKANPRPVTADQWRRIAAILTEKGGQDNGQGTNVD